MTREEAVAVLKAFMENPLFSDQHKATFNIAIHDIKQRHDWDINNLILINKDNYEPLEQELTTKNDIRDNRVKDELNRVKDELEPTTKNEVLDKIRAEIKALSNANPSYWHSGDMVDRDDVFEILDKYKAEQEE